MKTGLIAALDTTDPQRARAWATAIAPHCGMLKLGLEFYLANGAAGVRLIDDRPVFLDLKLHDIPNTVAGGVRAILPLVAPGIGAFIVLCILFAWNDYLFAAIIGSGGAKTLPAATRELVQPQNIQWGQIMAAGVVTTLPMMFLGLVIRKYLVTGLTMGAVKE